MEDPRSDTTNRNTINKEQKLKRLEDKVVLVTGASSGFGRAIALSCAADGAHVALVARRQEALEEVAETIRADGGRAAVCVADVSDEAQILTAVTKAQEALGAIDVLVNNAGTNVVERSIQTTSSDQWRYLLAVNLDSAFIFTKAVLPLMIERKQGTIINVASRAAVYPSLMAGVGYSASKLGMEALTKVTNEEANPHNVRATVLYPGEGATPLLDRRPSPPPDAKRAKMLQPEDLGQTVVFLASLHPRVNIEQLTIYPTQK